MVSSEPHPQLCGRKATPTAVQRQATPTVVQCYVVVKENTKLHGDLEKARNEIRVSTTDVFTDTTLCFPCSMFQHLRGQLSVIQVRMYASDE